MLRYAMYVTMNIIFIHFDLHSFDISYPSVQTCQWERSTIVGDVLCISTKQGNSPPSILISLGLFKKPKGTLGQKFVSARCALR